MRKPTLKVCEYRHSETHPYYLDLRPFGQGRIFFKTKFRKLLAGEYYKRIRKR
jgi:hypothetical protein